MSQKIEFTRNYKDLSTDNGFQFEFFCDRCGTGYRTRFQPFALGTVSSALDAASSLFGGILGRAADMGERAKDATWERAYDGAFIKAVEELKPEFIQCPRCSTWVCRKSCWNEQKGLCKDCAPDLGVEMAAAQSSQTVEEIWAHAHVAEKDKEMLKQDEWKETIRATCPNCNAPLPGNVKFCPACGARIEAQAFCKECGAKLPPGAKFCTECGAKV